MAMSTELPGRVSEPNTREGLVKRISRGMYSLRPMVLTTMDAIFCAVVRFMGINLTPAACDSFLSSRVLPALHPLACAFPRGVR